MTLNDIFGPQNQGLRKYIKDQDFISQKALFHPQKRRFKTILVVIFYGILYINNKLLWSDPIIHNFLIHLSWKAGSIGMIFPGGMCGDRSKFANDR